ncbi:MAG: UDP-N-acetylmuramoyl-L-alanyl-D-glutamate--2,6-diaminopimelate ligase [Lentimicrobiaceae bacterium]|jgi:UDP-N-acetylmuramoyl-L-alanyl-D-glutamate--2,6-diaminopimelate ligase|nr:UDP-N-acetylmuramoyl-L-alanyl-D-glutamate--2,6-diaminopimelate ligase [Lentimicrobiaceae bacterium]
MSRILINILKSCPVEAIYGNAERIVSELTFDSRKVVRDAAFFAIKGTTNDGHEYISKAIKLGATTIVCEQIPDEKQTEITYIKVTDSAQALAIAASNYFDNPSQSLKLIGVTGTNGKTTTATLLYKLFASLGYACGLISTIENLIDGKHIDATHTTPDPIQLNALLAQMVAKGCSYAFMEVSSHAIDQQRIAGLSFVGGVFTNLTHDHLDYHKTFAVYRDTKKRFFDLLPDTAFALVNSDDKNGNFMLQNTAAKKYTYALKTNADFKGKIIESSFDGLILEINNKELHSAMIGRFNAYNLLAVYGTALLLKADSEEVMLALSSLQEPVGRFNVYRSDSGVIAIVDYAHTPDALQNVLQTINAIRTHNEQLITVVGAGGERDKLKRPEMARIAGELSTKVILTSDNPRNEDPDEIIAQMRVGIQPHHYNRVVAITNRKEAIRTAILVAQQGDIILVAGKGHETYQEIKGKKYDFDDMKVLLEMFNASDE